jgi:hypothetical protein
MATYRALADIQPAWNMPWIPSGTVFTDAQVPPGWQPTGACWPLLLPSSSWTSPASMSITAGSVRAITRSFPTSSNSLGAITTTWSAMVSPSVGRLRSLGCNPPGTAIQFQPPFLRANPISNTEVQFSCCRVVTATNGMDGYFLVSLAIRSCWPSVKYRWLRYCISFRSAASIFDCCFSLIPSSNTNRKIVQSAPTAIPTTMSQNATRWTAAEYLGRSNIIPTPTAMLARTAEDNNTTWGQNGASSPEINELMNVKIAAMLGWLVVAGLAITSLLKSLYALWREHHPRSN